MSSFIAYDSIIGGVTLRQTQQSSWNPGSKTARFAAAGATSDALIVGREATPKATIQTRDLAGVLTGLSISSGLNVSGGSIVIPWNRTADGGTFQSGGTHYEISAANGLAIPTEISAKQGDESATASVDINFRSIDGRVSPFAENPAASLAASAFNAVWGLGPVVLNGSQLLEVTGSTVKTGLEVVPLFANGGIYPDRLRLKTPFVPSISIPARDLAQLSGGNAIWKSLTSITVYYIQLADTGFVGDGTAAHISITLTGGLAVIESMSGSVGEDAEVQYLFEGKTLSASTTATIPV